MKFIAIGPYSYGIGSTQQQATQRMRRNVPSYIPRGYGYNVYEAHPDSSVDEMGGIVSPKGHRPKLVIEYRRKTA